MRNWFLFDHDVEVLGSSLIVTFQVIIVNILFAYNVVYILGAILLLKNHVDCLASVFIKAIRQLHGLKVSDGLHEIVDLSVRRIKVLWRHHTFSVFKLLLQLQVSFLIG